MQFVETPKWADEMAERVAEAVRSRQLDLDAGFLPEALKPETGQLSGSKTALAAMVANYTNVALDTLVTFSAAYRSTAPLTAGYTLLRSCTESSARLWWLVSPTSRRTSERRAVASALRTLREYRAAGFTSDAEERVREVLEVMKLQSRQVGQVEGVRARADGSLAFPNRGRDIRVGGESIPTMTDLLQEMNLEEHVWRWGSAATHAEAWLAEMHVEGRREKGSDGVGFMGSARRDVTAAMLDSALAVFDESFDTRARWVDGF